MPNEFRSSSPLISGSPATPRSGFSVWCRRCFTEWPVEKLLGVIVILLVAGGLWKLGVGYGLLPAGDFPRAAEDRWQAVFLVNNQVYFGHLKSYNRGYVALDDVYYLQVLQPLQQQPPDQPQPQLNLVKLGQELHGPEDRMFIPKDRILFWEDMKADSQVVQAIESTRK